MIIETPPLYVPETETVEHLIHETSLKCLLAALPIALEALRDKRIALRDIRTSPEWPLTTDDIDFLIKRVDEQIIQLEGFPKEMFD